MLSEKSNHINTGEKILFSQYATLIQNLWDMVTNRSRLVCVDEMVMTILGVAEKKEKAKYFFSLIIDSITGQNLVFSLVISKQV